MTDTIARHRVGKTIFETMVDLENAIKFKKGEEININDIIRDNAIYTDLKKGMTAGKGELEQAFSTSDFQEVVKKIVLKGNIEVTQEFRNEEIEKKRKQIIDFLTRNAIDTRSNRPYTSDIIDSAINQAGVKVDNKPIEKQIHQITETLKKVIPIKIETKKLLIKIPAQFTGQTYGLLQEYKEKESWLPDGTLEIILNIPVGLQSDFYDRLNSVTHGSAITEEIKEK